MPGAVRVLRDCKFPARVPAQQLPTRPSRRVVDLRSSREFDIIKKKEILLRAAARDGKHVAENGVGGSNAAGALRGVVDDARIQGEQLIVTAAVQRQGFPLAFSDQAANVLPRYGPDSGIHGDLPPLMHVPDVKGE